MTPPQYRSIIDPPELIDFIRTNYPDAIWQRGKTPFFTRVSNKPALPPTSSMRWCCQEFKEGAGIAFLRVMGVRIMESPSRAKRWKTLVRHSDGGTILCPIAYWTDDDVWQFTRAENIPHCSLYDEGFDRIGCVGCPLPGPECMAREFTRWPRYRDAWHRAIIANWEKWHNVPRRDGKPRGHAKFRNGEHLWQWWITRKNDSPKGSGCQGEFLFAKSDAEE